MTTQVYQNTFAKVIGMVNLKQMYKYVHIIADDSTLNLRLVAEDQYVTTLISFTTHFHNEIHATVDFDDFLKFLIPLTEIHDIRFVDDGPDFKGKISVIGKIGSLDVQYELNNHGDADTIMNVDIHDVDKFTSVNTYDVDGLRSILDYHRVLSNFTQIAQDEDGLKLATEFEKVKTILNKHDKMYIEYNIDHRGWYRSKWLPIIDETVENVIVAMGVRNGTVILFSISGEGYEMKHLISNFDL